MESQAHLRPCGGLEGKTVYLKPVDPFKRMVEACKRIGDEKTGIDVEPSQHPTVPGLVVLKPVPRKAAPETENESVTPAKSESAAGPDHEARLALIARIDRLLAFEKRIAELESENRLLSDLVGRLAGENRDLRSRAAPGEAKPATP
jgi:hypothetical protein